MRKFLGTLLIVALIVAAVGVYRGWFGVSADDQPGETNLRLARKKIPSHPLFLLGMLRSNRAVQRLKS